MRIRLRSIWPKIFLVIFLFITALVLLYTLLFNYITEESLLEQKRKQDLASIQALEQGISMLASAVEDMGRTVCASLEARELFERARAARLSGGRYMDLDAGPCSRRFADASANVPAVSFMGPDGRFIGEHLLDRGRLSWCFNPAQLVRLRPGEPFWTDPFTIELTGTGVQYRVMASLMPAHGERGELLGYVVCFMDTDRIYELVAQSADDITVLDAAKCIVAAKQRIPSYTSLYQHAKIAYTLLLEDHSVIVPVDGRRLVVTTRIYDPLRLQLVMQSSFDSISSQLGAHYSKLAAMVAGGLVFALLTALFVARLFTKPIVRLRDVMAEASGGNLSVRFLARSSDEIGQLGADLNQFLDTIQQLMAQTVDHQRRKRELQLQLLQGQVQPHFLYNVLEMISSLIQCGMNREALSAIQSLAGFYRISLNKGSDIITVRDEVRLAESYLRLQKLRYVEFVDYNLAIDPNALGCVIPKLTLQPLIENAIYHGLKGRNTRGIVSVSGALSGDAVVFEVYDNGAGMDAQRLAVLRDMVANPNADERAPHFGLGSVINRLSIYFGDRAEIQIDSEPDTFTSVRISVPAVRDARGGESRVESGDH